MNCGPHEKELFYRFCQSSTSVLPSSQQLRRTSKRQGGAETYLLPPQQQLALASWRLDSLHKSDKLSIYLKLMHQGPLTMIAPMEPRLIALSRCQATIPGVRFPNSIHAVRESNMKASRLAKSLASRQLLLLLSWVEPAHDLPEIGQQRLKSNKIDSIAIMLKATHD